MKLYNVDYVEATATIVSVKGFNSEDDANGAPQKDEAARLTVREKTDLNGLPAPILEALCDFKAKKGEKIESIDALWEAINPPPKPRTVKVPTAKEVAAEAQPIIEGEASIENNGSEPLQSLPSDGTSSTSGDTAVSENGETAGKDESMSTPKGGKSKSAAKKKVAKKKAAKKVAKKKVAAKKKAAPKAPKTPKVPKVKGERKPIPTGLPREGSKADKLLKLILKPGGATFNEMFKATGWKEMRGTASVLAERAGKKLTMNKDPNGKKETRWEAK